MRANSVHSIDMGEYLCPGLFLAAAIDADDDAENDVSLKGCVWVDVFGIRLSLGIAF